MKGYEALHSRAAYFPLERGLIRVTGEDRVRLIHAMCTNNIEELKPGQGVYAFFLSVQGRVIADAHILVLEDALLIDTGADTKTKLYEHLDRYIIADDATLEDLSDQMMVMAEEGPRTLDLLAKFGLEPGPYAVAPFLEGYAARLSYTGQPGVWLYLPARGMGFDDIEDADGEAVETVRIENGRPLHGVDFSEANIAQETGQMHALHFSKGCYVGQEIVERVRSRGHVNRGLASLTIDAQVAPQRGTKVFAGSKEAGEITSAAFSPATGKVVALGILRAELTNSPLTVNGATASARSAGSPVLK